MVDGRPDPLAPFREELAGLEAAGMLRSRSAYPGPCGKRVSAGGRDLLNLASNDYLALAAHPELAAAARAALEGNGTATGGSRLLGGGQEGHRELEAEVAEYRPLGGALVFNAGYMANVGVVQALAPRLRAIYCDRLCHASVADGLRLARVPFHRYRHLDLGHLSDLLDRQERPWECLVISETLFSMDGDWADLDGLADLQAKHGFLLYLDEAHSTGCRPGWVEGLIARAGDGLLVMGTFGKALGGFGAYVAGPPVLIEYLVNRARSFIFSTSLPPAVAAADLAGLRLARREAWRADRLRDLAERARAAFRARGLSTGGSASHIVPVVLGDARRTAAVSSHLRDLGALAPPVRPPTVPAGTARLRCNLRCDFTEAEVDGLAGRVAAAVAAADGAGG